MLTACARKAVGPALLACLFYSQTAFSQIKSSAPDPQGSDGQTTANEIVVTPFRSETTLRAVGSSITVIKHDEIEKYGSAPLIEVLRGTVGLSVTDNGGQGSSSNVTLRGGSVGQTLVMIDGVRIGDPSDVSSSFNFGMIMPADIERIEILRGPQSALYGSDAMGGVINIIMRKGVGKPKAEVTIEGGSYGTRGVRGSVSGQQDSVSYSFAVAGLTTDGFSRYGYRIGRITSALAQPLEKDGADKMQVSARLGWTVNDRIEIESGLIGAVNTVRLDGYDQLGNFGDNAYNRERDATGQFWLKGNYVTPSKDDKTSITVFANRTARRTGYEMYLRPDYLTWGAAANDYRGDRYGTEIQHDHRWSGGYGTTTFGLRNENETILNTDDFIPRGQSPVVDVSASQVTNSAYVMHRLPVGQRLTVSLGGRVDDVDRSDTFATWRATAAYGLDETGTKLRASIGTGAKAPTLYQLYNPYRPNLTTATALSPERSVGVDFGIDQDLPKSLGTTSFGVFYNKYRDLIAWRDLSYVPIYTGEYYNVSRAETKGVEATLDLVVLPGVLKMRNSYTFTLAEDLSTQTMLLQRPQHQGVAGFVYTGINDLEIEPRVVMVGHRMDYSMSGNIRLAPYARFDVLSNYKISEILTGYLRMENLTNAHYQVVHDFGTAGRSFLLGLKAKW